MRLSLRLLAPLSAAALIPAAALAAPIPDYAAAPTPYTGAEIFPCENSGGTTSYKCDVADAAKVGISGLISGSPSAGHCVEWVSATQIEDAGAACGVTVPGSNTQLLFNNSGALGAASGWQYLSAGTLYSALTGTTAALSLNSSGSAYGQIGTVNSTEFGLCYGSSETMLGTCPLLWGPNLTAGYGGSLTQINGLLQLTTGGDIVLTGYLTGSATGSLLDITTGNLLAFGTTENVGLCYAGTANTLEVDNGACGNTSGKLIANTVTAATLTPTSTLNLPDGGSDTAGGVLQVGGHADGQGSGMIFEASSTAPGTLPVPGVTTYGGGAIGLPQDGVYLGVTGEYLYPGLTIQGYGTPQTEGCSPFCQNNDLTFEDGAGNVIAGLWATPLGAGHPWPFTIGSAATYSPTAANEGLRLVQLNFADVIPDGTVEGPRITWQPGPSQHSENPAFVGVGPESPANINFRVGPASNDVSPWDDVAADQPDIDTAGCHGVGIASGTAFEGGPGVAWEGKLCALSGGGVEVENGAKSAAAPIKASIYETVATTVAGLSTVDPSPSTGDRAVVTDATACTFNSAVTGSGSTKCPVVYTGSWVAG